MGLFSSLMSLPGVDAPPERPGERLRVFVPDDLAETEWFAATDSARMWRVYHEDYAVCILPPELNDRESGALYSYRNTEIRCRPYSAYFYEPDTLHANRVIFQAAAFYVMRVRTSLVVELARDLGLGDRPHFRAAESDAPLVLAAFERLTRSLAMRDPLAAQTALGDALRVSLADAGEARGSEPGLTQAGVRRARDYLHAHAVDRVRLDELARASGTSRYHLVHSFRRTFGVAPHAYLSAIRCELAARQLRAGVAPSQVEVGFYDQSHLNRHFTRAYGVTPAAYQRAVT